MALQPLDAAVATGAIVTVGEWAAGKHLSIRVVVGAGAYALGLTLLNDISANLASKFAGLILVIAAFMYLPAVAWRAGLLSHTKYPKAPVWAGGVK
jgi:hypothetical protein